MSEVPQGRGVLTKEVQEIGSQFMGRKITKDELRLIVYVQYVMVNEQRVKREHINQIDRDILDVWEKAGYITKEGFALTVTKKFWDFMCEILYVSYVNYEEN